MLHERNFNMKKLTDYALFLPLSVVLVWLIREFYLAINLEWTNGFTLQYFLIFYLVAYALNSKSYKPYVRVLMVLGAVFCLVGDTFLANAFRHHFSLGGLRMPLGMLGFFIGHMLWFVTLLGFNPTTTKKKLMMSMSIVFGVLLILWFALINHNFDLLSILALVYSLALGMPLAFSIANLKHKTFLLLTIFYSIFIFSDMLIGINDIRGWDVPMYGFMVWFTYAIAISGIAYALVSHGGRIHKQDERTNG